MMPLGALRRFFQQHNPCGQYLIIGFSGGPDSFALLDGCHRLQQEHGYSLVVAHLDHGWRESSQQEAQRLEEYVRDRGLQWASRRVQMDKGGNLEERGRQARLTFFKQLHDRLGPQAVLVLGHQADDLVETTLKRVLEGASLDKLHGLRPVHTLDGMKVWRPLLSCTRADIERYCLRKRLPVLTDPSNHDERFLRARMRRKLIPQIEQVFGKGIRRPLTLLAQRSLALEQQGALQASSTLEERCGKGS